MNFFDLIDRYQVTGLLPSPCFYNFLARTTFVLESLPEAKNPGQDAFFWGILSLTVVILEIKAYKSLKPTKSVLWTSCVVIFIGDVSISQR